MSDIKEYRAKLRGELDVLFDATEVALSEWSGAGNLQFPILVAGLAVKYNWDERAMRENDPIIRKYVRQHPDWYVTRGAHGGIMKRSEYERKNASKIAKELAKKEMAASLPDHQAPITLPE